MESNIISKLNYNVRIRDITIMVIRMIELATRSKFYISR